MWAVRACWLLGALLCEASQPTSCGMEGKRCSMPRDCCEGFACSEGDWEHSTDYTCRRFGPKPTHEEYKEKLREFYARRYSNEAELDDVLDRTLTRWEGREELMLHIVKQKYPAKEEL
mgnify:CR=1 FL=1|jgi:hypothetical protein